VSTDPHPPIACTLEATAVPERLARWSELAGHVIERAAVPGGVRVRFDGSVAPATIATLAADELACCGFLAFSIRLESGTTTLEVTAPHEARDVVDLLLPERDGSR
jgi:hypothetical protein